MRSSSLLSQHASIFSFSHSRRDPSIPRPHLAVKASEPLLHAKSLLSRTRILQIHTTYSRITMNRWARTYRSLRSDRSRCRSRSRMRDHRRYRLLCMTLVLLLVLRMKAERRVVRTPRCRTRIWLDPSFSSAVKDSRPNKRKLYCSEAWTEECLRHSRREEKVGVN